MFKAIVLGAALALSAVPAQAVEVTIQGRVGNGFYSITTDREDLRRNTWRDYRTTFESRRHCERSLNYDRGYEHRRARHGDVLVQCRRVYVPVRCYDYRDRGPCYDIRWAPTRHYRGWERYEY